MKTNRNKSRNKNKISWRQKFLLFLLVLSMIPVFFATKKIIVAFSQTKDRNRKEISKATFDPEPVEIVEITSDGKKLKLNEKFTQEDDWLKDFTIKFKNISGKPILYVSIVIGFPETDSTGNRMVYFLKYGVNPLIQKNGKDDFMLLAPDETVEVKLTPEKRTKLKDFLAQRHFLADLTKAHLTLMVVHFEDGTYWSAGSIFRPDPNKPGKFIAVDENNQEEE